MKQVVILGGGFGGLNAALGLRRADAQVTLIDRRISTSSSRFSTKSRPGLSPGDITAPLRSVLRKQKNTKVLLGDAIDLDIENRHVLLRDGAKIGYDVLIVGPAHGTSISATTTEPRRPRLEEHRGRNRDAPQDPLRVRSRRA